MPSQDKKKRCLKYSTKRMIVPNLHLLTLEAPAVAKAVQPGQFVIVRASEEGERIPLSVSDWNADDGTVTLIFMEVGDTTGTLAALESGMSIPTVVGPLGKPTEIEKFGTVMCVGGCYGIGSIYPGCSSLEAKRKQSHHYNRGKELLSFLLGR